MKLIVAGIITMLLVIAIIFGSATFGHSADKADVGKLIDFAIAQKFDNLDKDSYTVEHFDTINGPKLKHASFVIKEQLAVAEDYIYNLHYLHISYAPGNIVIGKPYTLSIVVKEVRDAYSPNSKTYAQWSIADHNIDGTQDRFLKQFVIVMENFQNEGHNLQLLPQWPAGLLNYRWFDPPEKEVQIFYDKEIKFWVEKLIGLDK